MNWKNNPGCFINTGEYNNQEIYFISKEEKLTYESYRKRKPKNWIYQDNKKNPLTYKFNEYGYRSKYNDIADLDEYYIAIGCSHTLGAGVHEEHRYSNIVETETGVPVVNLGYSGGSALYIFYNISYFLSCNVKKPKAIFIQWPAVDRYSVLTHAGVDRLMHNHVGTRHKRSVKAFHLTFPTAIRETSYFSYYTTINLLKTANIPNLNLSREPYENVLTWDNVDAARDQFHFGVQSHKNLANVILNNL